MKTKYVLTALALPALLAACTNDDFMDQRVPAEESSLLKDRAKVELTLKAERMDAESPTTRLVGQDGKDGGIEWFWEGQNDKIGAVLVDYVKQGDNYTVVDASSYPKYVLTNYPFAPQISTKVKEANFATQTAVVKGAYVFYNRYDGQNIERGNIYHEIPRILKANEGHEAGLKQVGTAEYNGQNFFISPIINIGVKDGEEMESYVAMKGVHSVLKFTLDTKLVNSEGDPDYYYKKGFTVNKIVLNRLDDGKFNLDFTLNPASLASVQRNALNAWANENGIEPEEKAYRAGIFDANTGAIIATGDNNEDIQAAIKVVDPALTDPRNSIALTNNVKSADLVYQLAEPKVMMKGETMELMVVVPSDKYGQINITEKDEQYEGKTQGVFLMTVYTSEGIYRTYLLSSDLKAENGSLEQAEAGNYIFGRGKMYTMPRKTLKIGGGETNITLFEQAEGFDVETTEDWNYTIDYIKDHFRDYGNVNDWNTPTIRLTAGKVIDVDANHYFPAFPVKYEGNATLNLKGQSAYVFNPTHAIFATGNDRPTLQIVGQATSTITFEGDIKAGIKDYYGKKGVDGTDITAAIRLLSDAEISVAKSQKVNFELLESATNLSVDVEGEVNVTNAAATETAGKVTVKEQAVVTINGKYNNIADVTIRENGTMNLNEAAQNAGTFDIWGTLNSEKNFANSVITNNWEIAGQKIKNGEKAATLTVQGWAEGMNNTARGEAFFNQITNGKSGIINTVASKSSKANYGGLVVAGKLDDKGGCVASTTATLTNKGIINDGGELFAANVESTNEIRLGTDPYALIWLGAGNVTAGTTKGYNGSVILEDATEYPMVDNYYTKKNEIADAVEGIIETSLTNENFADVMKDNVTYNGKQQTAWGRLNQITLLDDVKVNVDAATKTFILADNAKLTANKVDIEVEKVIVKGKNAAIAAIPATGGTSQAITAGSVNVLEGAELTVEAKANVIFANASKEVLTIAGKLLNKGYLDAHYTDPVEIKTTIVKGGELVNEGKMSMPSSPKKGFYGNNFELLRNLLKQLYVSNGSYKGTFGSLTARVDYSNYALSTWSNQTSWENQTEQISLTSIKNILAGIGGESTLRMIGGFQAVEFTTSGRYWTLYLGGVSGKQVIADADFGAFKSYVETYIEEVASIAKGEKEVPYENNTWFNITNEGTLDLLFSANPANATKAWAYGESKNGNTATKKGKFTNELK